MTAEMVAAFAAVTPAVRADVGDDVWQAVDKEALLRAIAALLWAAFDRYRDVKLVTLRLAFIRKTIYLRDLEFLLVRFAGPRPGATR